MKYFDRIYREFENVYTEFSQSPGAARLLSGDLGAAQYASALREIYFQTRENPQIQALATVYFRGDRREFVKSFLGHAKSEVGHDALALQDLAALGVDTSGIRDQSPLPETIALLAFPFYQIQHRDPVGYLGYLFFLEFMPTRYGEEFAKCLERAGVPGEAMSFLQEHADVDHAHNRLMERYVEGMVTSEEEFEAVVIGLRITGKLYGEMLGAAFARADGEGENCCGVK